MATTSDEKQEWIARWRQERACSATELAKLCCGWRPDSDVIPGNDREEVEANVVKLERTKQSIARAYRTGELTAMKDRILASVGELFYGEAPFFALHDAALWAAPRFPAFPREIVSTSVELAAAVGGPMSSSPSSMEAALKPEKQSDISIEERTNEVRALLNGKPPGERLAILRDRCGLSVADVAGELEVSEGAIKKHRSGRVPHPKQRQAYITLFNKHLRTNLTAPDLFV
jgi:hypothetical protein